MVEKQIPETVEETSRYANLEKLCGSTLPIEKLETFQKAIPEFYLFLEKMRQLLAPLDDEESASVSDERSVGPRGI